MGPQSKTQKVVGCKSSSSKSIKFYLHMEQDDQKSHLILCSFYLNKPSSSGGPQSQHPRSCLTHQRRSSHLLPHNLSYHHKVCHFCWPSQTNFKDDSPQTIDGLRPIDTKKPECEVAGSHIQSPRICSQAISITPVFSNIRVSTRPPVYLLS